MKEFKRGIVISVVFILGLLFVGCGKEEKNQDEMVEYGEKSQAVYLVQMDINPSVIIGYDENQMVVYLSSNNQDGYDLLTKYKSEELIGKTLETATNCIISNAYEEGYDRQDFDVKVISIGAKKADTKMTAQALGNAVQNCDFEVKVSIEAPENTGDKVAFRYDPENVESVDLITEIIENIETGEIVSVTCDACRGSGVIHCAKQKCLVCDGTGKTQCPRCNGGKWEENEKTGVACLNCGGVGTVECLSCSGTGEWSAWDEMCRGCNGWGVLVEDPENKCRECGRKIEGEMWIHVLTAHKGGEKCPECGEFQDDLQMHKARAHWDPGYYEFEYVKCPICNEMTKFDLDAHIKIHDNAMTCEICGAYYRKDGFEEHYLSTHSNLNLPQCPACGEHVYGDLDQHIEQNHANMQKCKHCGEYISSDQVNAHNNAKHSEIYAPECPICHVHVIGNTLQGHMDQCHSHMVKCPKCGEYVGTSLEDHYQKRHSEE